MTEDQPVDYLAPGAHPANPALRNPLFERQNVRVKLPCETCVHQGVCTIEEQIESDITLTIIGVGRPVELALSCSIYQERGPDDWRPTTTRRGPDRSHHKRPLVEVAAVRPDRRPMSDEAKARMSRAQTLRWERRRAEGR